MVSVNPKLKSNKEEIDMENKKVDIESVDDKYRRWFMFSFFIYVIWFFVTLATVLFNLGVDGTTKDIIFAIGIVLTFIICVLFYFAVVKETEHEHPKVKSW